MEAKRARAASIAIGALLLTTHGLAIAPQPAGAAVSGTDVSWRASTNVLTINAGAGQDNQFELFSGWLVGAPQTEANRRFVVMEDDDTLPAITVSSGPCSTDAIIRDGVTYTNAPGNESFVSCSLPLAQVVLNAGDSSVDGEDDVDVSGDFANDAVPANLPLVINGQSGDDVISGGDGNDVLDGGTGDDDIDGGNGNDVITGANGFDTVSGDAGNDSLDGGGDDDIVVGGSGVDSLLGGSGNDSLRAGDATADTTVDCGPGTTDDAQVDAQPADPVTNCETVVPVGVEHVSVNAGVLTTSVLGNDPNRLALDDAGSGTVDVWESTTAVVVLVPGSGCVATSEIAARCTGVASIAADTGGGDDTVIANVAEPVTLRGGDGNDALLAGRGVDTLDGGNGDDHIDAFDAVADNITCAAGDDTVMVDGTDVPPSDCEHVTHPATAAVSAGVLVARETTGAANELAFKMNHATGITVTNGDIGVAALAGCRRTDFAIADCTGATSIDAATGRGNDSISNGTNFPATFDGGDGDDVLTGGWANDTLIGGPGRDSLAGSGGDDVLLARDTQADALVDCGSGTNDRAVVDGPDVETAVNCETVDVPPPPPPPAATGSVSVGTDGVMRFTVNSDVQDAVVATQQAAGVVLVRDASLSALTRGAGCTAPAPDDPAAAMCSGVARVQIDTGSLDDSITMNGTLPSTLIGGDGSDVVLGGDGNDVLDAGSGGSHDADVLDGRGGFDLVSYAPRTVPVTVTDDAGPTAPGDDGAAGEGDDVHAEMVLGSQAGSTLTGSAAADVLVGFGGNDTIDGRDGNDVIAAGAGNDVLRGGAGDDVLDGGDGNDTLQGDAGADDLKGGAGMDIAQMTSNDGTHGVFVSFDEIANDGTDTNGDRTSGEEADDVRNTVEEVRGTNFTDVMYGDANAQTLRGYGGNDTMNGRGGNDFLDGGDGADLLTGGAGDDIVLGGAGRDFLFGGEDNDVLIARDTESDSWIACDAGATDVAILDSVTVDPAPQNCEYLDRP